jgi:hypothetical protein
VKLYTIDQLTEMTGRNAASIIKAADDPWVGLELFGDHRRLGVVVAEAALPKLREALSRVPLNCGVKRTKVRRVRAHPVFSAPQMARLG